MDNSAIQLIALAVTILVPVLGAIWYLKSEINGLRTSLEAKVDAVNTSLEAKIDANREAITNVRVELAKLQGALQGPAMMARSGGADTVATAS